MLCHLRDSVVMLLQARACALYARSYVGLMCETIIIEFELEAKRQLMFQAVLQAEDGLAFVRCLGGVQQLWTTSVQVEALYLWLKEQEPDFNIRILREYVWQGEG